MEFLIIWIQIGKYNCCVVVQMLFDQTHGCVSHVLLLFFLCSDNDGILDIKEKGSVDCCAPLVGKTGHLLDSDKNGVPDYRQKESDSNNIIG